MRIRKVSEVGLSNGTDVSESVPAVFDKLVTQKEPTAQIEDGETDYAALLVSAVVAQIKQTPQACPTADQKTQPVIICSLSYKTLTISFTTNNQYGI